MPFSQESIGDAVGLSAPHVNRMLGELKREGLLAIDGHEVRILDRTSLQIMAEFEPSYLTRTSFPHPLGERRSLSSGVRPLRHRITLPSRN